MGYRIQTVQGDITKVDDLELFSIGYCKRG